MGRTASALAAVTLSLVLAACSPGLVPAALETVAPVPPSVRSTPPAPVEPSTPPPPAEPSPEPTFDASVGPITAELAERMVPTSWREGCPVPLEDLRHVTMSHVTFEGTVATGELVVHADVADGVVEVFAELFDAQFPIHSMRLIDDFDGDDDASMAADNTSAFNCRAITGGTGWSEHAYGRAIDLNPVENPYVRGDHVAPPEGRAFVDRPDAPGVIRADDVVVRAFAAAGWQWGGDWDRPIDYQHFSISGR
ncbi:M15 family metallopeptidase [Actinotalea sp. K2]|uniref:M15 family metallopeptidase n=1 Tax=Actinotalea sp. K2 TaxID=2939438 RepID=UPI0020182557|nr:M15 family metallopeptidase [Actinotalea sp. K2]MCL3861013.1 M15 family metallopeptidase [Actinotalea sp. K2]